MRVGKAADSVYAHRVFQGAMHRVQPYYVRPQKHKGCAERLEQTEVKLDAEGCL